MDGELGWWSRWGEDWVYRRDSLLEDYAGATALHHGVVLDVDRSWSILQEQLWLRL